MKAASRRGIAGRVRSRLGRQGLSIREKGGLSAAFQLFYAMRRRIVSPASPRAANSRPIIGQIGMAPPVVAGGGGGGGAGGGGGGGGGAGTAAVGVEGRVIRVDGAGSSSTE